MSECRGKHSWNGLKDLCFPVPETEADIAEAIDKWIELGRTVESQGEDHKLGPYYKMIALEQLMSVGQAKLHLENMKMLDEDFDSLLLKCREYASRRRLEKMHKKNADAMDVDAMAEEIEGDLTELGEGYWYQEGEWSRFDYVGLGICH